MAAGARTTPCSALYEHMLVAVNELVKGREGRMMLCQQHALVRRSQQHPEVALQKAIRHCYGNVAQKAEEVRHA